jgi:hypothetical protein
MKFKLILIKPISKIFRLVLTWLFKLFVSKLDNGSFFEAAGDLAGICIRGYHVSLISENDRIGVEIHLSQEV